MFICQGCKTVSKPREPKTLVVVQTRPMEYHNPPDGPYVNPLEQVISKGYETVKEIALCPPCVEAHVPF